MTLLGQLLIFVTLLCHNNIMMKYENVLDIFAERLKELIKEKGWTIQEFSLYIHIPRTTINSWLLKQKSPKIDYLCDIANFFKVSTDYLLGRENN